MPHLEAVIICFYFSCFYRYHFGKVCPRSLYEYMGKEETKGNADLLTAYMKDETGSVTNPGLKDDIRDTVVATWKVEDLWLHDKTELTQYVVWRYIGTANGVFRTTPGGVETKDYDPRLRPW